MRRIQIALCALFALSSAANAATVTITPDQSIYSIGDTITLSIVGDSEGGTDRGILGFLLFDKSLASWLSTTQQPLTSFGGSLTWVRGYSASGCNWSNLPPGCPAFDQIAGLTPPLAVDNLLVSTMKLTAIAPGVLDFSWETETTTPGFWGWEFRFFGLTDAPGTSVTILNPEPIATPEPSSGLLVIAGVLGLATRRRANA